MVTVQSDRAENFDQPVAVCFPNTMGLAPGAAAAFWSFNHDSGEWEIAAAMTAIDEDGDPRRPEHEVGGPA